jgi:hypothetical protein
MMRSSLAGRAVAGGLCRASSAQAGRRPSAPAPQLWSRSLAEAGWGPKLLLFI